MKKKVELTIEELDRAEVFVRKALANLSKGATPKEIDVLTATKKIAEAMRKMKSSLHRPST